MNGPRSRVVVKDDAPTLAYPKAFIPSTDKQMGLGNNTVLVCAVRIALPLIIGKVSMEKALSGFFCYSTFFSNNGHNSRREMSA